MGNKAIQRFCYELYKIDWISSHLTALSEIEGAKEQYFKGLANGDFDSEYTFSEYLNEYGFPDGFPVCFEEFLDNEYLDFDYIQELLNGSKQCLELYQSDRRMLHD